MIRVVSIDDEPLALRQLELYIAKVPFLELAASCSSAAAAGPFLDGADAVFLDINMPDLSGMDFIKSMQNPPAVIFITAYSEYAVEGFRVNAVDYLLKPFSFKEFLASCEKLREHLQMKEALSARKTGPVLHFKADYKTISIDAGKIVFVFRGHRRSSYIQSVFRYSCVGISRQDKSTVPQHLHQRHADCQKNRKRFFDTIHCFLLLLCLYYRCSAGHRQQADCRTVFILNSILMVLLPE